MKVSQLAAVHDEIKELKNQIQVYQDNKSTIHNSDSNVHPFDSNFHPRRRPRLFRCRSCERNNKSYCNHCFSCGGTDHRKNDCKNQQNQQKN